MSIVAHDFQDAARRLADQAPPLSESQRARLVLLLTGSDARTRIRIAARLRPDLPAGIRRAEVVSDGT